MVSLIVIVILSIIGLIIVKVINLRHKFFIITLIILILFLYTTISIVADKNNLDLTTTNGFFNSIKVYISWLANGFENLKSLSGRAVELDWKSSNKTFFKD